MPNYAQINAGLRGAQAMTGNALNYLADQDRIRIAERQTQLEEDKWAEAQRLQRGQELGNMTLQAEQRAIEAQQDMGTFLAQNHDVAEGLFHTARQNNKRFADLTQGKDVQLVRGEDGRFRLAERDRNGAVKFLQRKDGQGDVAFTPQQFAEYLDMENARFGRMSARRAYRIAEQKVKSGEADPQEFEAWVSQQFGPAYQQLVQEAARRGYDVTDEELPERVVSNLFGEISADENAEIDAQIAASGQTGTESQIDLRRLSPQQRARAEQALAANAGQDVTDFVAALANRQPPVEEQQLAANTSPLRGGARTVGGGRSMQAPTKPSLREPAPVPENTPGMLEQMVNDYQQGGIPRVLASGMVPVHQATTAAASQVGGDLAYSLGYLTGGKERAQRWGQGTKDFIAGRDEEATPTEAPTGETSKPALSVPDFTKVRADNLRPGQRRAVVAKLQTAFTDTKKDEYKYSNSDRAAALTNLWAVNKLPHDNAIIANLMAGDDMRGSALAYAKATAKHAASLARESATDQKMRMEIWKHNEEYRKEFAKSFTEDQYRQMGFSNADDAAVNFDGAYAASKTVLSRLGYPSDWRDMTQSERAHFGNALRRAMQVNGKVVGDFLGFGGTTIDGRNKVSQEIFPPLYAASMLAETNPQLFEAYYHDAQRQGFDAPDKIYEEIGKVVLQSKGVLTDSGEK